MTLLVPDVGEVVLLTDLLSAGNNWTLKLYKVDVTPAETDTAGTYTEADFTGYSAKTLTRSVSGGTWSTPATSTGTTSSSYAQQIWSPTSAQTIYGYYFVDASTGTLVLAEKFAASRSLSNGDTFKLTPKVELA